MNILFFTCWYPTKDNPLKGLFIKEHAKAIHYSGNRITVFALDIGYGNKAFEKTTEVFKDENGIDTHILHIKSFFYKWIYINPLYMYYETKKYFSKEIYPSFKPDIIHSNILSPSAIIGDWLASKYKIPHIITEHWSKVNNFMKKNLFSVYGKKAYNHAFAVTVVSDFLKKDITKYFENSDKIKIIPNVVDTNIFLYKPKAESNTLIYTAIATWEYPKAPMYFVHALNEVQKNIGKKIILNMIGDGSLLKEIKKLSLNYQIIFLGNIHRKIVAETLNQSDYFLHASHTETFSVVVAEALATGTPVVASNVGALPELINGKNGILCKNTIEEWVKAIKNILEKEFDRVQISETIFSKYSEKKIGDLFNQLYSYIPNKNK